MLGFAPMLLLRSLFFLLILLFHYAVFSQTRPTTAGEVFFNFVELHTEDVESIMGPTWFDDVFNDTESWTVSGAAELLNVLEPLPTPHTLTVLKDTESLRRVQSRLDRFHFQTGSDVFINYVREHFRRKLQQSRLQLKGDALESALEKLMLSQMPSRRDAPLWEERIRDSAQHWSVLEALLFLDDLENKRDMETDIIVRRLNSTSFFEITYAFFTSRLEVYTEYFGKSHIKKILDKTFAPFQRGEVKNIRDMLDAVFTYFDFGQDIMVEILSNNLQAISNSNLEVFNRRTAWLEDFLGRGDRGKNEIKSIVRRKKSLNIIDSVNMQINKKTGEYENETEFRVNFLASRGGYDQEEIIALFLSNPMAFSRGDLSTDKIDYLEKLLGVSGRDGKAELDWVIQNKSFQSIVSFKIDKNKEGNFENEYVEFLKKREFNPEQIADLFKSDPRIFSVGDLSTDKITYLEELLGVSGRDGKAEVNWMIQNGNFADIVNFRVYKNKEGKLENEYIEFLKKRELNPEQIADVFKYSPQAFSMSIRIRMSELFADKVAYLEDYLGKGDRDKGKKKLDQIILKEEGFRALVLFDYNKNADPPNRVIDFLENNLHFNQDQVIEIMEDYFSKLFTERSTLVTSKGYVQSLIEKAPNVCPESLSKKQQILNPLMKS